MNSYANWQCPLWRDETRKTKHFDIPLYGRFEVTSPIATNGLWQVEYLSKGKLYQGYIEDRFMEWYVEGMPHDIVDLVPLQTIEPYDGEQYIVWKGVRYVNLCGPICVADILDLSLEELLTKWEALDPVFYKRIMGGSGKGLTNNADLIKLLGLFGRLAKPLTFQKYTPRLFAEFVRTNFGVIVSVHLNTMTGSLNGGKVLHWSRVLEVVLEGLDLGWVRVYNPYTNSEQWLSWREFLATTRAPYGLVT